MCCRNSESREKRQAGITALSLASNRSHIDSRSHSDKPSDSAFRPSDFRFNIQDFSSPPTCSDIFFLIPDVISRDMGSQEESPVGSSQSPLGSPIGSSQSPIGSTQVGEYSNQPTPTNSAAEEVADTFNEAEDVEEGVTKEDGSGSGGGSGTTFVDLD
ncbi:hypothetical protein L1887_32611 [Cichorium endivia]|nr:hypothetical protein L1887_32611 [Cichorium endivia]